MSLFNLFRPKWKHSDTQVRLNEVRQLPIESNQSPFTELARKDQEPKVRSAAIGKILSIDTLIDLLQSEGNAEVIQSIKKRLEERISVQILDQDAQVSWFSYVVETRIYELAASKSSRVEIRKAALAKINKEAVLIDLLLGESDQSLAEEIFARLNREDSFKKALKSKFPSVSASAKSKLAALTAEREKIEAEKRTQAQISAIKSALSRLVDSIQILESESEIQTLAAAWQDLKTANSDADIDNLLNHVKSKLNEQKEIQARIAAENALKASWIQHATQLCEALEVLCKEGLSSQAVQAQDLGEQWNSHKATAKSEWEFAKSWDERFERSMDNWEIRLDRLLQNEAKASETTDTVSETPIPSIDNEIAATASPEVDPTEQKIILEKTQQLEAIIDSVRKMDPNGDFESIQEQLRNAHAHWKEISSSHREAFVALWKTFKEACTPFEEIGQWAKWHNEKKKQSLVDEIEALVSSEKPDAQVYQEYRVIQEAWKTAGSISHEKHQELWGRFKTATDQVIQRCKSFFEERNAERENNLAAKQALCEEIRNAIASDNTQEQGDSLKIFQERWKQIGPVPREQNDSIWQEYRSLCDQLYAKRREAHKVEHDHRIGNLRLKEELCSKVEALSELDDWVEGSRQIRTFQEEWKKIGFVPKADSDAIWNRFRNACDAFYERKRVHFEQIDAQKKLNLEQKTKLCQEIEAMNINELSASTLDRVEAIKEEWKQIGHVSKEDSDEIWDRFCRATDAILEKQAESDSQLRDELTRRVTLKQEIIEKAKETAESSDWAIASSGLQDLQNQWREIGRAGIADQDLWNAFRQVCDAFFERKRDHYEIMEQHRINNLDEKIALIEEAERISAGVHDDNARREIKMLRHRWKEIGQVPRKHADKIWKRFNKACDAVFATEDKAEE